MGGSLVRNRKTSPGKSRREGVKMRKGRILKNADVKKYPCAMFGCDRKAFRIIVRGVKTPQGIISGFYGYCKNHFETACF